MTEKKAEMAQAMVNLRDEVLRLGRRIAALEASAHAPRADPYRSDQRWVLSIAEKMGLKPELGGRSALYILTEIQLIEFAIACRKATQ
jgi:hypothetical protein